VNYQENIMSAGRHSFETYQITHDAVQIAIAAAAKKATEIAAKMSISVVDNSATLVGFLRMDGAFLISTEICQKKARCAASLGFDPQVGDEVLKNEHPRVREGLLAHPDYIEIRGGLPIIEQGRVIGAIGVSGGAEADDLACALAGVSALDL
jgi:uncharacterized protein GlcG (DUF336 family)